MCDFKCMTLHYTRNPRTCFLHQITRTGVSLCLATQTWLCYSPWHPTADSGPPLPLLPRCQYVTFTTPCVSHSDDVNRMHCPKCNHQHLQRFGPGASTPFRTCVGAHTSPTSEMAAALASATLPPSLAVDEPIAPPFAGMKLGTTPLGEK